MDKLRVALGLVAGLLINPVSADFYAGAGLGYGTLDIHNRYGYGKMDGSGFNLQAMVGYSWKFFDMEAGYMSMQEVSGGHITQEKGGVKASEDIAGMTLRGLFKIPMDENFKLLLTIGSTNLEENEVWTTAKFRVDRVVETYTYRKNEKNWSEMYGVGLQFVGSDRINWRLRWERITSDRVRPDLFNLDILYKF